MILNNFYNCKSLTGTTKSLVSTFHPSCYIIDSNLNRVGYDSPSDGIIQQLNCSRGPDLQVASFSNMWIGYEEKELKDMTNAELYYCHKDKIAGLTEVELIKVQDIYSKNDCVIGKNYTYSVRNDSGSPITLNTVELQDWQRSFVVIKEKFSDVVLQPGQTITVTIKINNLAVDLPPSLNPNDLAFPNTTTTKE